MENPYLYKQHKILILQGTQKHNDYVDNAEIYIHLNSWTKKLKKLHEHLPIHFFGEIWYGSWKHQIKDYDVIIIFDALRDRDVISFIHKVNPSARIIVYYINKFKPGARNDPDNFKNMPCELWSFDKKDCEAKKMIFNPFCYDDVFSDPENQIAFSDPENLETELYDAFFIGVNKNRLSTLYKLKNLLEKYQYRTKILVKTDKHSSYKNIPDEAKTLLIDYSIEYKDVIKFIRQSKCIIEIQCPGQNGLTLRAMESIFFKKKLITDNFDILNYDFYQKENIYLMGHDPEERLETFLLSPFKPVAENIIRQYTWEAWLERFFK